MLLCASEVHGRKKLERPTTQQSLIVCECAGDKKALLEKKCLRIYFIIYKVQTNVDNSKCLNKKKDEKTVGDCGKKSEIKDVKTSLKSDFWKKKIKK